MRHKILRPDPQTPNFKLIWDNTENSLIYLDFAPLMREVNHQIGDKFAFLHWQARPKGLRRWGVYDGFTNNYYSCDADKIEIDKVEHKLIQIDENVIRTLPTAVIYYDKVKINIDKFPHITINSLDYDFLSSFSPSSLHRDYNNNNGNLRHDITYPKVVEKSH